MLGKLIAGILISAIATFVLYRALAPFRRIWAGDARVISALPTRFGRVEARNYLAYLLWVVPGTAGLALVGIAVLLRTLVPGADALGRGVAILGLPLFLAAWPLAVLQVMVNATNRPRFLVPAPYRNQPGAVAAERQRRARKSALSPTNHFVEILEVPGDHGGSPWLVAACSEPTCSWYADSDPALGQAAEEALRAKARGHSRNIAKQVVRPLG